MLRKKPLAIANRLTVALSLAAMLACDKSGGTMGEPATGASTAGKTNGCGDGVPGAVPGTDDASTGVEFCEPGAVHRLEAVACKTAGGECTTSVDCGSDKVCVCAFVFQTPEEASVENKQNVCVPSNCETDTDCPDGWCLVALSPCDNHPVGQFCKRRRTSASDGRIAITRPVPTTRTRASTRASLTNARECEYAWAWTPA